jgi:hypothetical protein
VARRPETLCRLRQLSKNRQRFQNLDHPIAMGPHNAVILYRAELPAEGFNRNSQEINQFRALHGQRQYRRFRRFACIGAGKAPSLPKKSWKGVTTAACGLLK